MKKRILFLTFVLTTIVSYGQVSEWLINIDSTHYVADVSSDNQGNSYVCGVSLGIGWIVGSHISSGGININSTYYRSPNLTSPTAEMGFFAKVDSNGNTQWIKQLTCGINYDTYVSDIHVDNNNDILIGVGFWDSLWVENDTTIFYPRSSLLRMRKAILKYSSSGTFLWAKVLPGRVLPNANYYYSRWNQFANDNFNNIYLQNDSVYTPVNSIHAYVLKLDPTGNITDSFPKGRYSNDFDLDNSGNIWTSWSTAFYPSDTLLLKYDSMGNLLSMLQGIGDIEIRELESDNNGNLYAIGYFGGASATLAGHTLLRGNGKTNAFIFKLNPFGHIRWIKQLEDCYNNFPFWSSQNISDFLVDDNGDLLILGNYAHATCLFNDSFASPFPNDSLAMFLIKLDPSGKMIWSKYSYGQYYQSAVSLEKGIKDNIYVGIAASGSVTDTMYVDNLKGNTKIGGYLLRIKDGANLLSGKVYVDANSNSNPDVGDVFFSGKVISVNGANNYYAITDYDGMYQANVLKGSWSSQYTHPIKYHTSAPLAHSILFTSLNQVDDDNHFKLTGTPGVYDMRVNLTPLIASLTNQHPYTNVEMDFFNVGTTNISDTCLLEINPDLELNYASIPPTDTGLTKLMWVFSNMNPYESVKTHLQFEYKNSQIGLGDTLNFQTSLYSNALDSFPKDNRDSASLIVVGPYDPNDKLVQPPGDVLPQFVQEGDYLYYTIRFQNTGTAAASYVRINDTISNDLILESFEMVSASHTYRIELTNPNVLDFIFENINLPDSGADWLASQGYVKFRIKADPSLSHGDFIENKAAIYFDANEAIITNYARTNIYDWTGQEEEVFHDKGLTIYPNPNSGNFHIMISDKIGTEKMSAVIYDLTGRQVFEDANLRFENQRAQLSISDLKPGLYIVKLNSGDKVYESRVVIR